MSNLREALLREEKELLKLINDITTDSSAIYKNEKIPEGHLRISSSKTTVDYYFQPTSLKGLRLKEKYIRKKDRMFASALAQRDYDFRLLETAKKRLYMIQRDLSLYPDDELQNLYLNMSTHRQKIVTPRVFSDEEYIRQWLSKEYKGKPFAEGVAEIYTNRGERVRSKSEKIIADMLNMYQVPYRYEYPISLVGMGLVHPDFTVLSKQNRKEKFWEHMGMMDQSDYCDKALRKIEMYQKNDIIIGDRLIVTHETSKRPLDTVTIEKYIKRFLI